MKFRTLKYVRACKDVGAEYMIPVVDLWSEMDGATVNREKYLSDGLHLSARYLVYFDHLLSLILKQHRYFFICSGGQVVFESLTNTISKYYPEWRPESLPMQLPEWSQIDYYNPAHSFQ